MNEEQTKDQSDPGKENVTGTTSSSSGPHSRPSSGIEASKVTTPIETNDKIPGDSSPTGKLSPVNNVSSPVHEANKISRTSSPTDTKISDLHDEFEVKETRRQSSSDKITTSRPTSGSGSASRPTSARKAINEIHGHADEEVFTGTRTPPDHTSRPSSGIIKHQGPQVQRRQTHKIDNDVKTSGTEGQIVVNNETVSRPTSKSKESSRPSSAKDNAADLLPADETDTSKTSDTLNNTNEDQTKINLIQAKKMTSSPTDTKISDLHDEFEVKETRGQSSSDKITTSRPTSGSGSASRPTSASKTTKEIHGHTDEEVFTGTRTPSDHTSRPSSGITKTSRPTSAKTTNTQIDNDVKTSGTEGQIVVNNETVSRPTSKSKESSRPSSAKDNAADLLPADETDTSKTSDTLNNTNEDQTKNQSDSGKENVTGTTSSSSGPHSRPSSGIDASKVTTPIETNDEIPGDSSPTGKLSPVNNVSSPVHEANKISRTSSPTDTKISDLHDEFEVKETRGQSSSDKITTSRPTSGSGSASRPTSASKTTKEIHGHTDEEVFTGTRTPSDHTSRPSSGITKTSRPTSAKTTNTQIDNDVKTSGTEGQIVVNNETVSRPTSKSKESSRPSSAKDNAADLLPADETDTSKTSDTLNNMNEDQTKDQSDPGKENVTGTTSSSSGKLSPVNNVSSPVHEANKISRTSSPTDTKISDLHDEFEVKETRRQSSSDKITTSRPTSGSGSASRPTSARKAINEIHGHADEEVFTGTRTPPDHTSRPSSGITKTSRPTSAKTTNTQIDNDVKTSGTEGQIVVNNETVSRPTSKSKESSRPSSAKDNAADLLPADETDTSKTSDTLNNTNEDQTKNQSDSGKENVTGTTSSSSGPHSRPSSGIDASKKPLQSKPMIKYLEILHLQENCHLSIMTSSPTDTKISDLHDEFEVKETRRQSSSDKITTSRPTSGSGSASRPTSASKTTKEIHGHTDEEVFTGTRTPSDHTSRPSSGITKTSRPTSAKTTNTQIDNDVKTSGTEGQIVVNNETVSRPTSKSKESSRPSSAKDNAADLLPADETDTSKTSDTLNNTNEDQTKNQSDSGKENVTGTTSSSSGPHSRPSSGIDASKVTTPIETNDKIPGDSSPTGKLSPVNNVSSPVHEANKISRTSSPTDTKISDLHDEFEVKETRRQSSSDKITTSRPTSGSGSASRPTSASKTIKEIHGHADEEVFTGTRTPPDHTSRPSSGINKTSRPTSAKTTNTQIDNDVKTSGTEGQIVVNNETVSRPTSKSKESSRPSSAKDNAADLLPADETDTSKTSDTLNNMNEDQTKINLIQAKKIPSSGIDASKVTTPIETNDKIPGDSSPTGKLSPVNNVSSPVHEANKISRTSSPTDTKISDLHDEFEVKETRGQSSSDKITTSRPTSGSGSASRPTSARKVINEIHGHADEEVFTGTRTPPDHTSRPSSGITKTSRPTSAKTTNTQIDNDVKTSGTEGQIVVNNETVSRPTSKSKESSRPSSAKDNAADLLPADETDTSKTSDTLNNMNEDQTKINLIQAKKIPSLGIDASKVTTPIETNDKIPGDSVPTGKLSPVNNVSSPVHEANKISRTSSPTDTKISDLHDEFEVKETRRQSSSDKITTSRPTSGSGSASRPTSASKAIKEIHGHADEEVFTGTRTPPDHTSRPSSGITKTSRPTSAKTTNTQIDNDVKTSGTEGQIVVNNETVSRPTSKSKESSRPSSAKDNAADLLPADETDTSKTSDTLNNMNEDQTKDQSDPGKENVTGTTSSSSGPHSRPSSGIEASKVTTPIETNDKIPGDSSPTGKLSPVNNVSSPVHEANKISRTSSPTDTKISDLHDEFEVKETRRQSSSDKITTSRPTSGSGSASRPTSARKAINEIHGHADEEVFTGTRTPPDHTSRPSSGNNKTSRPTSAKTTNTQIDNDVKTSGTEGQIVVNNETVSRPTSKSKESSRPSSAKDNAADLLPADETDTSKTSDTLNNMNEDQTKINLIQAKKIPSSGIDASKVTTPIETNDKIPGDSSPTGKLSPVNNVSSPVHEANKISRTSSPTDTKISDLHDEFEVKETRRQSSSDKITTSRPTSGSGSASRPTSARKAINEIHGHADEEVFTGKLSPVNNVSSPVHEANKISRTSSPTDTKISDLHDEFEVKETRRQSSSDKITTSRPTSGSGSASRPTSASKAINEIHGHADEEVFTGTRTPPDHTSRPSSGITKKTSRPTSAKTTNTQIDNDVKTSGTEGQIVVNNETVSRPTSKSKESSRPSSAKDNAADLLPADETDTSKTSDTLNNMNEEQTKNQSDPGKENVTGTTSSSSGPHSRPSSGIDASKVTTPIETNDKIPGDSSPTGKLSPVNNVSSPVHEANKISRTSSPTDTKISDLHDEFEVKETRRSSSSTQNYNIKTNIRFKEAHPDQQVRERPLTKYMDTPMKKKYLQVIEHLLTTSRPSSGNNKTSRPTSAKTTNTQINNDVKTSGTEGQIVVNNETVSRPTSKSKESSRPSSAKDNAADLLPADETDISKTSDTLNNMNEDQTKDQSDPGKENVTGTTSSSSGPHSRPSSGIDASKVTTPIETNNKIPGDSSPTGKLSPVNNVSSPVHEANKISRTSSPTDTKISDLHDELKVKETRRQSSSDKITTSRPTSGSGSASRPRSASKTTNEIHGHADEEVFTGTRTPPDHTSRPSSGNNKTSRPTSAKTTNTQIDNDVKTSGTEGQIVVNNETVSRPTSKSKESSRPSKAKDNAADLLPADETDTSKTSDTLNNMNEDQTKDQSDPGKENVTGTTSSSSGPHSRPSSGIEASKVTTPIETNDKIPGDSSPTGKLSPVNVSSSVHEANKISRTSSSTDTKISDLHDEFEVKETRRQSSSDKITTSRPTSGSGSASRPTSASKAINEIHGHADEEVFTGTRTPPDHTSRPSSGITKTSRPTSAKTTNTQIDNDVKTSGTVGQIVVNNETVSRPTSKSKDS
ncbi:unnamed protein product [Mytilus coruscus]|nr:unnamed protein product [Mytilus coruscus]